MDQESELHHTFVHGCRRGPNQYVRHADHRLGSGCQDHPVWRFDSDGGFAEATWTCKKDRWFIQNKGILADGRKASMVNVIKQVDQNSFTWQTVERTAGGELLPNIDEVLIVRE